jgi:hypothetical protein
LNQIDFLYWYDIDVEYFLNNAIDSQQAANIQHVCVDFEYIVDEDMIRHGLAIFSLIKQTCVNLATVDMSIDPRRRPDFSYIRSWFANQEHDVVAFDTLLKSIPSLLTINVVIYELGLVPFPRREIEALGWNITEVSRAEYYYGKDFFTLDESEDDMGE